MDITIKDPAYKKAYDIVNTYGLNVSDLGIDMSSLDSFANSFKNDDDVFKFYKYLDTQGIVSSPDFASFKDISGMSEIIPNIVEPDVNSEEAGKLLGANSVEAMNIAPEDYVEGAEIPLQTTASSLGLSSLELESQRNKKIKKTYTDNLNKLKYSFTKDGKLDEENTEYQAAVKNLQRQYEKDLENSKKITLEDSYVQKYNISNPTISVNVKGKDGKTTKVNTGVHSWGLRETAVDEQDLETGDYYFTKADTDEELVPFLSNQYPNFTFEKVYEPARFKQGQGDKIKVIAENGKELTFRVGDHLEGSESLYSTKASLFNFINQNGLDVLATQKNLSQMGSDYYKIASTAFNSENPAEGGIAINESQQFDIDQFGSFQSKTTELGTFNVFTPNQQLFKTPRQIMIEKIEETYPGKYFPNVPDILDNIEEYSTMKADKITKDPITEGIKMFLEDHDRGEYFDQSRNKRTYGKFVPSGNLFNLENPEMDQTIDENTFIEQALAGGTNVGWKERPGTNEAERYLGQQYSGPGTLIWQQATQTLSQARNKAGQPAPSVDDIKTYVARVRYEEMKAKILDSNWDAYLGEVSTEKKGELIGFDILKKDANIVRSAQLSSLNEIEISKFNATENGMMINYFEQIYFGSEDFPTPGPGETPVKLKNGKIVSKSLFDDYNNAVEGSKAHYQTLAQRRDESWKLADESNDLNTAWDLLRRDYSVWGKATTEFGLMFADIGIGATYLAGKAQKYLSPTYWTGEALEALDVPDEMNIFKQSWDLAEEATQQMNVTYQDWKNDVRNDLMKDVSFHQNEWGGRAAFAGSFGTFVATEVGRQIPILLTMMASGGTAAPWVIGAYAAGDHWMRNDYQQEISGKYRAEWVDAAAAVGYGAAEGVFEALTTVPILRRGGDLIKRMGQRSVVDYRVAMKNYFMAQAPRIPLETVSEGIGEGLTQISQNLIDGRPISENVDHAMFVGGMFGFAMSTSPMIMGMVAQRFTDYGKMAEFRGLSADLQSLQMQRDQLRVEGAESGVIEAYDKEIGEVKDKLNVMAKEKFDFINNTLSKDANNGLTLSMIRSEQLRSQAEEIINSTKLAPGVKQQQLRRIKEQFDSNEYNSNIFKNSNAFGNDFTLLKKNDTKAYDDYVQRAKQKIRSDGNKSNDFQPNIDEVEAIAEDLYIEDRVNANYELQSKINEQANLNITLGRVQSKEDSYKYIDNIIDEVRSDLTNAGQSEEFIESQVEKIKLAKEGIRNGNNGLNFSPVIIDGKEVTKDYSLVVVDNAVKNNKLQVGTHEIGHAIFTKLLGTNSQDFAPLAEAIVDYLSTVEGGSDVLTRILVRDRQASQMADELVMNFLEEVGNNNVPLDPRFAALFGRGASDGVSTATKGEMQFDFKGQTDAVAFLIGLGKAISTGQINSDVIEAAKQSKALEASRRVKAKRKATQEARNNLVEKASSNIAETAEEKTGRRKNREEEILKIYNKYALDSKGAPISRSEWQTFLDTEEGLTTLGKIFELYSKDLLTIARNNPDAVGAAVRPLMMHIRTFNPQVNNDLAGWIGSQLKNKLGTGIKDLTKGQAPVGTKRIGQEREGARALDIADTSSEINLDEQIESFREGIGVETGSEIYNTVVKAGERVVGGRLPKFEFTYKSGKRKGQTVKLNDVKARLKENPNDAQALTDLNNIYKNVRQELANAYDSFLFTEIKKSMGTGDAYKSYLGAIRPTIMKNMSIADLVAMERLSKQKTLTKLEASNLSPAKIKQYEGSGDLVYTNPNAGPNLYSRLNPTEQEFIEFFEKRGRKDALAKNISKQFGFDVTMQAMNDNIVDVIDKAFPTENLNNIAKDAAAKEMLQNFATAIGTGINTKFSGTLNENINEELISGLENMVSVDGISNDVKIRKPQIRAVVEGVYPNLTKKAITQIVNDLNKILAPYGRLINKYEAVDVNVEEFINEVLTDNEAQSIADFFGVGNVTDLFRNKVDSQRGFVKLLAADMKKNYTNPLELAANFWHYKGGLEDGSNNPTRLMTFFNEGSGGHSQAYIDQFIAPVFSTTENPIVAVKTKNTKHPIFGFNIEQVEFTYKDKTKAVVNSQRRTTQATTKDMVNNTMSELELSRRKKDSDRAFNFVVDVYESASNLVNDNVGNNENLAMLVAGFGANMKGPIRAGARLRYLPLNPPTTQLNINGKKQFEYEHGIPGLVVNLAIADKIFHNNAEIDLAKLQENYTVGVIHVDFNSNFGTLFQSRMPFGYKIGDSPITRWVNKYTIGGPMHGLFDLDINGPVKEVDDAVKLSEQMIAANNVNKKVLSNNVITMKASDNLAEVVGYAATVDNALNIARDPNAPVRKIRVFDFDDTLATSNNIVFAKKGNETIELNAEEFAAEGEKLLSEGYTFDFTDFNTVRDGGRGPLFSIAEKIRDARGTEDVFVLTARAPEAQVPIHEFLKSQGLNIPLANITGLGNSTGAAKAEWIINKAAEGYNDFYFADDAIGNVNAVKDALAQIDVKSEVQQAKMKFSENVDEDFNNIIEQTTGVKSFKEYSAAKAKTIGSNKGKFKFWIPYGAEDFMGLIYPLLTKGKLGDSQMAWFKKHLIDPYARAKHDISTARINLMDDFKALKKTLQVPAELRKTNETGFTNEQAVRVYVWTAMGYDIPGLSKADLKELNDFIESNPTLQTFAEQLLVINKNNEYPQPGRDWLGGTITTDLLNGLNTLYRAEALKEWQENADLIFSEKNLNKLETIYGPKYREAMENILTRMKSGKNRLASGSRLSNRVLDYINNSTGVIMFFNMRSAVLQAISSTNFINWSFNNPYQAGKAFANQKQYWKDFMFLMNSNYLRDRRKGQKLDISESEIANAAATATNKAKAAISYILSKGYLPTQMMDSFAIASGGATFYRNRVNDLIKQGIEIKEAEEKAYTEFIEKSEESQQSSDPSKISSQQASDLGRLTLTFGVTPMQYGRLTKRAYQDLINGRGDAKENISKIAYYTFVQNMIFNALQQAVFAVGFGDGDDDEKKEEKLYDTANGMADSVLRGLGIGGVAISVVKNFLLDLYERSDRSRPEYVDSIWKLTQFSPPISSKISRLRQAAWYFDSKKRRQEMIDKGFSIDNNAYKAAAKVIAATTNIPLDRMLLKIENVQAALSEEADWWQSMAMLLGWPKWQIMPDEKDKNKNTNPFKKGRGSSSDSGNPFVKAKREKKKQNNPFIK